MTDHLVTTIENRRSGARLIRFAGVLDEHNRLDEIAESVGAGMALINLAGIERINSKGVRDWISWLSSLHDKGTRPVLIACSPAVVDQLNRIKNFAGNAVVKSFQLPYSCATCNSEKRRARGLSSKRIAGFQRPRTTSSAARTGQLAWSRSIFCA